MDKMLENYLKTEEIKKMSLKELDIFAEDIRAFLIEKVSKCGGHLASNLGVVELTLSLYNVFDFTKDKVIWDVGHQSYVHKILTGRKDKFDKLRKYGGLSGFPKKCESSFDIFETGHSSTSISAALGMARARDIKGEKHEVVAVIGDGALTGGMAFEALNDVGYNKTRMVIILNDNQMSIGRNVGGMSTYLSKLRVDPAYNRFKKDFDSALKKIPGIGHGMSRSVDKIKSSIKQLVVPGMLFEDMGLKYFGPIDGHNIKELSKVMSAAKEINGPVIIHVVTKKGKGYSFAETNPGKFHGIGPFDFESGECESNGETSYSKIFGEELAVLGEENKNIVAITAAMRDGTGMKSFAEKYPKRFFDVGIAEQHAVTLAAGMAAAGLKPVFAVYSTFLQRAYDQIIHDVCIQKLPVVFAIDRAGIVGEDGETHQGIFDLSYLSHMPNMTIMAPKCVGELKTMLKFAVNAETPVAIRYPRGGDSNDSKLIPLENFKIGKWETIYGTGKIAIIATGKMVQTANIVRDKLKNAGYEAMLINACFIKPIDYDFVKSLAATGIKIVTIEDNVIHGGFGSLVLEYVNTLEEKVQVLNLGFPDKFIVHGSNEILYKQYKLDPMGIIESIMKIM